MRTADELTALVRMRVKMRRRRLENRTLWALFATCTVLCAGLLWLTGILGEGLHRADISQAYGAVLLFGNAGGYVLVGVIAFVCASAITIACIRRSEKRR